MSVSRVPARIAKDVRSDAGHRCGYCRASEAITSIPLVFDHIVPEAAGGPTTRENLWLACERCNRHKADRTAALDPETGQLVPLFNPRTQAWQTHFAWGHDSTQIIGLTSHGRATVLALQMNHPLAVLARKYWASAGWHPPLD